MGWPSTQSEVETWLKSVAKLDSAEVLDTFRENEIDGDVLFELTKDDIKELGIKKLGPVKKLVSSIAKGPLSGPPGASDATPAAPAVVTKSAAPVAPVVVTKPAAPAAKPQAEKKAAAPAKKQPQSSKKKTPAKKDAAANKPKAKAASAKKSATKAKPAAAKVNAGEKRKKPETPAAPSPPPVKKAKITPAATTPAGTTLNRKQKRAVKRLVGTGKTEAEALAQVLDETAAAKAQKATESAQKQPAKAATPKSTPKPAAVTVAKPAVADVEMSEASGASTPELSQPESSAAEDTQASTVPYSDGDSSSDSSDDGSSSESEEESSEDEAAALAQLAAAAAPQAPKEQPAVGYPNTMTMELPDFLKEDIAVTSISPGRILFLCHKTLKADGPSTKQALESWLWQNNKDAMKDVAKGSVSKTLDRALQKGIKLKKIVRQGPKFAINPRYNPNAGR